ncbi:MAG TPA: histidine kinase dimerization/phospho-acceptor domain-containing protein [Kofleriaceae bacterium]|nr:histidine kinase dimerization/phospho-acceptor domain-containing protein [Kofleriaceae bacterium]
MAATTLSTRTDALAGVIHELRTPLNGIIGFAELMHGGKAGPMLDVQREYLGDILTSARQLVRLIDGLRAAVAAADDGAVPAAVAVAVEPEVCRGG